MTLTKQLKQLRDATMMRMPPAIIKTFENSLKAIERDQIKEKALPMGAVLPDFLLTDVNGNDFQLADVHHADFLVLNFYRGGWCPYCNMELREYERLKAGFSAVGANLIAISAEVPPLAAKTAQSNAITFPVLTDKDAQFMKKLGIVFSLDENSQKSYEGFGIDFTKIHGNTHFELPVPAVYVIDRNSTVVFTHFEADYTTRIEPIDVLEAMKNILETK